jgi:hypothetical protein
MKIEIGDLLADKGRCGIIIDIFQGRDMYEYNYKVEWYSSGRSYIESYQNVGAIIKWLKKAKKQQQAVDSSEK